MITKPTLSPSDESSPIDPLLALSKFFIEQQPTLFNHSCAVDSAIQMLYGLAKDYVLDGKEYHDNFTETKDEVCDTHIKQLEQAQAPSIIQKVLEIMIPASINEVPSTSE
ncbi:uncharacterized protein BYT42DRAFT_614134 [Radiomyces spectabilis]|uniref:uncharacterized protein n=1 Tax=Radiomyces spectabilis TaxID=64574 RepID=UPI002220F231|nr:uncharacterized protein BYT42DRAFT_614134 [Radiomyces spectabilis]KAI8377447.1 hypothetical protein BYT42DRAFT_614134 [Radiomyces spectabilis]